MSLSRMYTPVLHFDDINGRPLVGGKLYTYEANSSTPAPTYRDKSGTLLNENPISLDERGECEVWLVDGLRYKMVLVDPIGTQVWEADDVSSSGSGSSSLRRINIFSSDHSVDVEENYVAQTDSFNVDLSVDYNNILNKPDIPDAAPSIMVTPWSDFQEWDGTTPIQFKDAWTSRTEVQVVGDKVDLKIKEGDTKYRIAVKKLGVYRLTVWFDVKWEGTPVNKTGNLNGFPLDFSKAFEESFASPATTDIAVINLDEQEWYYLGITRTTLDAPAGTKVSVRATVEYLGPITEAT